MRNVREFVPSSQLAEGIDTARITLELDSEAGFVDPRVGVFGGACLDVMEDLARVEIFGLANRTVETVRAPGELLDEAVQIGFGLGPEGAAREKPLLDQTIGAVQMHLVGAFTRLEEW